VRTPIGKRRCLADGIRPIFWPTLQGLIARTESIRERVDDVVGGCVTQGEQGCNVIRNGWVAAGLPQSVPCTSVDRQCGHRSKRCTSPHKA
jgi:acetyl-CoA C-acetyltransferase